MHVYHSFGEYMSIALCPLGHVYLVCLKYIKTIYLLCKITLNILLLFYTNTNYSNCNTFIILIYQPVSMQKAMQYVYI